MFRYYRFSQAILASTLLLCAAFTLAGAAPLPANLQLGSIPRLPDGGGWSIALPLGVPVSDCRLDSESKALRLVRSPDGAEAWLVFEPVASGPVSGSLEIVRGETIRRTTVAGEIIAASVDALPPVLVVSASGAATERRYLRLEGLPVPATCALDRTHASLGQALADGWVPLDVEPGFRVDESRGWIRLGESGLRIPLQYSVEQTITVLARTDLPAGWTHDSFRRFGEALDETGLRARIAVLGGREGMAWVRMLALRHNGFTGQYGFRPRYLREMPGVRGLGPLSARAVRVRALGARQGARRRRLITLGDRTAALWDPAEGLMARAEASGLLASRATAASGLHRNALFAVRRDLRSGENYLRRWSVRSDGGGNFLRGRIAEVSLEKRLGVRRLRPFALRARRSESAWPESPLSERLLLLAASDAWGKGASPVGLFSLRMDPDDPSRILSARRSFGTRLRWAAGDPPAYLRYAKGRLAGQGGYPARAEIGLSGLTPGRYVDITGLGERFAGSPYVQGVRHDVSGGAYGFEVPVFMGIEQIENQAVVRRYRYADGEAIIRASGNLGEVRGIAMKPSRRLRHAWALTRNPEGVRQLRLLTNGTPAGVNLPPRIDAGGDLFARRALVELRARAVDPNGDPLAIRWSAPGNEFGSPDSPLTVARFPEGTTQVRVAVREKGGIYGAVDMLNVTVTGASAVPPQSGLTTRITGLYPNPANPRLRVAFTLDHGGPVRIVVHDVAGRVVRTVLDEVRPTGAYDVEWNGRDDTGQPVASGVYLVKLTTNGQTDTQRGVIVR